MGRGDRKTKKGKIFKKSYGKHRPAKSGKPAFVPKAAAKDELIVKAAAVKAEVEVKEKKTVAQKVEKTVDHEKKPKVAKLEELTPEILVEEIDAKADKKATPEKKATAPKAAAPKKAAAADKKVAAPKTTKPKAAPVKAKTDSKKAK